jgi:hypothetical protein
MQVDITLKNYRCFPDSKPARISLRKDLTGFVGVNNSGKSSLLKFFYEFRGLFNKLSTRSDWSGALRGSPRQFNLATSVRDAAEVFCNTNNLDLQIELRVIPVGDIVEQSTPLTAERVLVTIPRNTMEWIAKLYLADTPFEIAPDMKLDFDGSKLYSDKATPIADFAGLLQTSHALSQTLYIGPFRNAITVGSSEPYFDIRIGRDFVESWRDFKTGSKKENNEAAYRLEQDIVKVFGFRGLQINPSHDNQTLQLLINGKAYKLSEVGSGLAQFIVVLANALIKQPSYILIDEPESNLHPQLQLDFLTTLASYASEGVLFATHSIGLARAYADRVYSVRRIDEGESEVTELEATPRLSEFLGELSFSGYRELGFDKVLLVEGSTEVKTIQQFLRKYKKDHQILLLSLGGGDLIKESSEAELQEIKRITDNVFALIDSERTAPDAPLPPNRKAFIEQCQRASIECRVLERRATENYFSDRAVELVKGPKYRAPEPYQKLSELPNGWSKAENWRMAREMTREELDETDLGEFLSSL